MEILQKYLTENDIPAFGEVLITPSLKDGITSIVQSQGIGGLKPNTVVMGWTGNPERAEDYLDSLGRMHRLGMNLVLVRPNADRPLSSTRSIDIWWADKENRELMALFSYLLLLNYEFSGHKLRIVRVIDDERGRTEVEKHLRRQMDHWRLNADVVVLVTDGDPRAAVREECKGSELLFVGFDVVDQSDPVRFVEEMNAFLDGMPTTCLVCSSGQIGMLE